MPPKISPGFLKKAGAVTRTAPILSFYEIFYKARRGKTQFCTKFFCLLFFQEKQGGGHGGQLLPGPPALEEAAVHQVIIPGYGPALALGVGQAPMSLTDGEEGGDLDIPVEAPEERMTERLTLYQILQTLEERDRKLIQYRYFQGKTQTQTAALLGMTQVQVSRREKKLLLFMRAAFDQ